MTTKTTDVFQVEHIEYVTDRPLDEVASALEGATGDLTDGKYTSEVTSARTRATSKPAPGGSRLTAGLCASSPSTTVAFSP